jgi:phage terminase small subunit
MSKCNPKPAIFDIIEGNPNHLTKQEIKDKQGRELHIGGFDFLPSENLQNDAAAKKLWDTQVAMILDAGADFVTTFDSKMLEDWCLACAEKDRLEKVKQEILKKFKSSGFTSEDYFKRIDELKIQGDINKLVDLSLRLRRALGLDPLSRLNALKKKSEPQKDTASKYEQEFGTI